MVVASETFLVSDIRPRLISFLRLVDVTVIRGWLGHTQLDTTNHYAQANTETKRKALEQVDPKLRSSKLPRMDPQPGLVGLAGLTRTIEIM